MPEPSILDEEPYVPNVPDLDKLNMAIIEWIEEAIIENPEGDYMSSERDRGAPTNVALDEEDEYWTAIARSLNDEQVVAFRERFWELNRITSILNQFRMKTEPNYLTKKDTRAYIERRAKDGFNSWHAMREIRDGKLVHQQ